MRPSTQSKERRAAWRALGIFLTITIALTSVFGGLMAYQGATPMLLVTGTADESFDALAFPPIMADYKPDAEVVLLDDVTHMGVVVGLEIQEPVISFLGKLSR